MDAEQANGSIPRHFGHDALALETRLANLNFPPPSIINRIEYNDLNLVDAWLRARAVSNIDTAA